MTEPQPVEFIEDRIPLEGIETAAQELVDLYGGTVTNAGAARIRFALPLRRGVSAAGGVECTLSWTAEGDEATVRLLCDRDVDAPRSQRIALLGAGVVGAFFWMLWPFFPNLGTLAWIGGVIAISAYFISLRKTSGGLASDFLQRLARRQRESIEPSTEEEAPKAS